MFRADFFERNARTLYYVGVFLLAVVCGALFVFAVNGGRLDHTPTQERKGGDAERMTE